MELQMQKISNGVNDRIYQTLVFNKTGSGYRRYFVAVSAIFALILILFNIYFIYAAVDILHALDSDKRRFKEFEYVYQESARLYQEVLREIGKEIVVESNFLRLGDSDFVARLPSLVLR